MMGYAGVSTRAALRTPPHSVRRIELWPAACLNPALYGLERQPVQRGYGAGGSSGCPPVCESGTPLGRALWHTRVRKQQVVCSHRNQQGFKPLFRHGQPVLLQSGDVSQNRLFHVGDRFFAASSLSDATRNAQALGHPVAVFTRMHNHLPHRNMDLTPTY
jgi:hypothetical protein